MPQSALPFALPDVLDVIPHRPPMVLIDRIVEASAEHIVTLSRITADKPFVTAAGMPAWAGIELMAQTIAAYAGVQARQHGEAVRLGFLLGTRRYESDCAFFAPGSTLRIQATRLLMDEQGLGVFECRIESDAGNVNANLNVFEPHNINDYLHLPAHTTVGEKN